MNIIRLDAIMDLTKAPSDEGGGQIVKSSATLFRKDFNRRKEIKGFTGSVVN